MRTALVLFAAASLSGCGGGIDLASFTDATKITVVNTFGQPVVPGGNGINPNPPEDPAGKGLAVAYYMTLMAENASGGAANLDAPAGTLYWRDTLGGLKDCAVFKPKISSDAVDPSATSGPLPKPRKLSVSFCNLDRNNLDPGGTQTVVGVDGKLQAANGLDQALTGFAKPRDKFLQVALFQEDPPGDLTFVNPGPYLYPSMLNWEKAPPANQKISSQLPAFGYAVIEYFDAGGARVFPSSTVSLTVPNAPRTFTAPANAKSISIRLVLGNLIAQVLPALMPYEFKTTVQTPVIQAGLAGPDTQGCAKIATRTFRINQIAYKANGSDAFTPLNASMFGNLANPSSHIFYETSAGNIPADPLAAPRAYSILVPLSSAAAANPDLEPMNLATDQLDSRFDISTPNMYLFAVTIRAPYIDPHWSLNAGFAVNTGNAGTLPFCLEVKKAGDTPGEFDPDAAQAKFVKIGTWAADQGGFEDGPVINGRTTRLVKNDADPKRNFVDLDADRFYVQVVDFTKIASPQITAGIGTLNGDPAGNIVAADKVFPDTVRAPPLDKNNIQFKDYEDSVTEIPLYQTTDSSGAPTGVFVSRSQLLTSEDPKVSEEKLLDDKHANDTPTPSIVSDDGFEVNNGFGNKIADEAKGDRTHKATADSFVDVIYPYVATPPTSSAPVVSGADEVVRLPVCERLPDSRQTIDLQVFVLLEPVRVMTHTASNGALTYYNGNSFRDVRQAHDTIYNSVLLGGDPDNIPKNLTLPSNIINATNQQPQPVVNSNFINAEIEGASLAWAPACLRFKASPAMTVDTETGMLTTNSTNRIATPPNRYITDKGTLDPSNTKMLDLTNLLWTNYGMDPADPRKIVVVFIPPPGKFPSDPDAWWGYTYHKEFAAFGVNPAGLNQAERDIASLMSEKTVIYINALNTVRRTLAHEIGHALTNGGDYPTKREIFYPSAAPDIDLTPSQGRRITPQTESDIRKCRPANEQTAPGNRILTTCP